MTSAMRGTAYALLLSAVNLTFAGCEKKAPPDSHIVQGYRLLTSNPKAAYDELGKAPNPSDPKVLLGRGLALEGLRRYEEAEKVLLQVRGAADEPVIAFALARVRVMQGKATEAQPLIDAATGKLANDLPALLLETCLANSESRARTALAHLNRWPEVARGAMGVPVTIPGEYHLARASLNEQLKDRVEADAAAAKSSKAKLTGERESFALVALAVKAGRLDLALKVLRKLDEETSSVPVRRQVAELAHGLNDHRLVGKILETLWGDDPALLRLRAEHAFATQQTNAEASLRTALGVTNDKKTRARLQQMLAEVLLRSGMLDQARAETEAMLKEHPDENGALFLARVDLAEGQPKAALQRLAPFLLAQVVPPAARELGAEAHLKLRHPEEARPLLDALLRERPNDIAAARLRIALEIEDGKPAEAVRVARELIARAPNSVDLRLLLAEAIQKVGGASAAAESLREGVGAIASDARLWLALAHAYDRAKAGDKALSVLEEAHQKLPEATVLTAALASKLGASNQAKRAAPLYEELIQNTNGDAVALNNLAMLYVDELGDANRAVELAERAHSLTPHPAVVDTLGWALFKRGKPGDLERARQLLDSVAAQLSSPTSKYHRGAVLIATKSVDEGRRLVQQALAQSGEFAEAAQARELLRTVP